MSIITHAPSHAPASSLDAPLPRADVAAPPSAIAPFNPDPTLTDKILQDYFHGNATLGDLASQAGISLNALTAWLASPDILARTTNFESACAGRLRITALNRLHHAVDACTIILQEFKDSACHEAGIQQGRGGSPSEHIRRDRETARKTSQLLLRFATFDPTRPRRHTRSPRALREQTGAAPIHLTHTSLDTLPTYTLTFTAPGFEPNGAAAPTASAIPGASGSIVSAPPGAADTINQPEPPESPGNTHNPGDHDEPTANTPPTATALPLPHPKLEASEISDLRGGALAPTTTAKPRPRPP
jgi:hypothetical protein